MRIVTSGAVPYKGISQKNYHTKRIRKEFDNQVKLKYEDNFIIYTHYSNIHY